MSHTPDPANDIGVVTDVPSDVTKAHVDGVEEKKALDSPIVSDEEEPVKEFREGGYGWWVTGSYYLPTLTTPN